MELIAYVCCGKMLLCGNYERVGGICEKESLFEFSGYIVKSSKSNDLGNKMAAGLSDRDAF